MTKAWSAHSYGGLGKHADNLYRSLAKRGHTVHVFTSAVRPPRAMDIEEEGRLVVHYCQSGDPGNGADMTFQKWLRPAFDAANASLVADGVAPNGFQVIHMESLPIFMPHFVNITIPLMPSWHGIMIDIWRENYMKALLAGKLNDTETLTKLDGILVGVASQIREFVNRFPYHIVLTERARLDLVRNHNMLPSRVITIHHSTDVDTFARKVPEGDALRGKLGIPLATNQSDVTVFGFASVLQEAKGIDLLLVAAPAIVALGPNVWIVIAGTGNDAIMAKVKGMAASPDCHGRVVLLGGLGPKDMPAFYSAIDVFLDLSLHHTGSNGVLIEAMLTGAMILAQDVGSVAMTNSPNNEFGLTFQPGNIGQVVALADSVVKREVDLRAITQKALERARASFSLTDMIDRYEALLYRVVQDGDGGMFVDADS